MTKVEAVLNEIISLCHEKDLNMHIVITDGDITIGHTCKTIADATLACSIIECTKVIKRRQELKERLN